MQTNATCSNTDELIARSRKSPPCWYRRAALLREAAVAPPHPPPNQTKLPVQARSVSPDLEKEKRWFALSWRRNIPEAVASMNVCVPRLPPSRTVCPIVGALCST